jgi:hypothetical protein
MTLCVLPQLEQRKAIRPGISPIGAMFATVSIGCPQFLQMVCLVSVLITPASDHTRASAGDPLPAEPHAAVDKVKGKRGSGAGGQKTKQPRDCATGAASLLSSSCRSLLRRAEAITR